RGALCTQTLSPRSSDQCSSTALFFFNDPPPTEIYTLSLHDALPILVGVRADRGEASALDRVLHGAEVVECAAREQLGFEGRGLRSEEHTSELQSLTNLVCRLLLEKKKKQNTRSPVQPKSCTALIPSF